MCVYQNINLFKINEAVHVFHKRCAKISLIFVSNKLGHVPKFTKSLFVCRKYARHTRLAPSNNLGRIYYVSCCKTGHAWTSPNKELCRTYCNDTNDL